ncbi:MAG: hypothetical protein ACKPCC_22520 [Dolichospermum sp.]
MMKMLKPGKSIQIRQHITPKARAITSQLSSRFGISLKDFEAACTGDLGAIQRIGTLSKQARFMNQYVPQLKESYLEIIQGTETYNLALADILKAAGSSALKIDRAANQTALADQKYVHGKIELFQQYLTDKKAENTRHVYQLNYQQIKGYMDAFLIDVDRSQQVIDQGLRPEIKQLETDRNYRDREINEYLSNGDEARLDLMPKKQYSGIKGKFQQLMTSLGF